MFRAFRNFMTMVFGEAGGTLLRDLIRGQIQGGASVLGERLRELVKMNPRHDLVLVLLTMDPQDRENLMEVYQEYLRQGRENRFVRELGEALPRTPDGKVDEERARRILKELNNVPMDELKMFLEFLNHDPIAEWFRYWVLGKGKEVAIQAAEFVSELAALGIHFVQDKTPKAAKSIDQWAANKAAPTVRDFRLWLETKGVRR